MSGKGAGKKRNRAAQSEQHGYQGRPGDAASRPHAGEAGGAHLEDNPERQRIMEKLRELDERRREEE
ncbi:MAG: hypothetical protein ACYC5F_09880 [Thermoleophilia bacterium]